MKFLFSLALKKRKHYLLAFLAMIAMLFFTLASQLEVITVGVITQKGPTFFELFAPVDEGHLQSTQKITREELEKRFDQLDTRHKGYITKEDTTKFLKKVERRGMLDRIITRIEKIFPLSENIRNLAILIGCVGLLKAVALFWHRLAIRLVSIHISRDLRQEYFEHIQMLPMKFYQNHDIGSLSARVVSDAFAIAEGINAALVNYLQTPFTVISTFILCFLTSWKLSMIVFFGLPAILYPILYIARKVRHVSKLIQKNQEHFSSVLIDFLAGVQTVKIFSMEEFSLKKYRAENDRMAKLEKKSARYGVSSRPIAHSIGMLLLTTALLYGLYVLQMDISEVLVYAGFLMVFYEPVKKFAEENNLIQRGAAAAERMEEVMSIQPQILDAPGASTLQSFHSSIEFRNVWFRYEQEWVLQDLSFTIEKGQTVAIVGPTGCGKSTIVQLLPRLYDIERGEILIDGKSLLSYTQKSLRETIAFVPQKAFLFQDTIAANIAYGRPYSQEDIKRAARQAHAEEFILELPKGYETILAETGKNLSGGQQQRLAIARALVKKAPILVMDEATSSLDTISENYIKEAISELHGQVTQIIIAHRLTTIEDADKIIYIEKGKKIAEGKKNELLSTCSGFKAMWDMLNIYTKVSV